MTSILVATESLDRVEPKPEAPITTMPSCAFGETTIAAL